MSPMLQDVAGFFSCQAWILFRYMETSHLFMHSSGGGHMCSSAPWLLWKSCCESISSRLCFRDCCVHPKSTHHALVTLPYTNCPWFSYTRHQRLIAIKYKQDPQIALSHSFFSLLLFLSLCINTRTIVSYVTKSEYKEFKNADSAAWSQSLGLSPPTSWPVTRSPASRRIMPGNQILCVSDRKSRVLGIQLYKDLSFHKW